MRNIILIGMPAAGKSTVGVILAKVMGYQFIDSDLLIQKRESKLLQEIITQKGLDGFLQIENEINRNLLVDESIIATGGSVIYSREAMEHLRKIGKIVYIQLSYHTIDERLGNIKQRGVVLRKGQTLKELYHERCPLYEKYAHIIVNAEGLETEKLMEKIKEKVTGLQENNSLPYKRLVK